MNKQLCYFQNFEKMTAIEQAAGHWDRLNRALRGHLSSTPPDLWLVSSEGFSLPTHSSLLRLVSCPSG